MGRPRQFDESETLQKSLEVFWRHGYEATTYKLLERATGVKGRSLINVFGDKDALFVRVLRHYRTMAAGVIEQVGSPLELYRTPRNKFVAGFIGSPRMNLLEGSEAQKHNAETIGIRPEHIDISQDSGTWQGKVGVAEHLGSDTFLHIHGVPGCDPLTVRTNGEVELRHGDTVFLTPRPDQIHKFGADGLRIA